MKGQVGRRMERIRPSRRRTGLTDEGQSHYRCFHYFMIMTYLELQKSLHVISQAGASPKDWGKKKKVYRDVFGHRPFPSKCFKQAMA